MQADTNDFNSVRNKTSGLAACSNFYCGTVADAAVATFVSRFWSAQ